MADVHLSVQIGPGGFARLVVIKRLRPSMLVRPAVTRMFEDEARLLGAVAHPNVVDVLDVGSDQSGPFLVLEYLSGETLAAVLRDQGRGRSPMPRSLACRIGADLAAGLAAAHAVGVLHRDLTPTNVVIGFAGTIKLIDFGIAKRAGAGGNTRSGTVKGKIAYLAPELLTGGVADRKSDLFQLGVVLYEMLTGRRLFDAVDDAGRIRAVLDRPIGQPSALVVGLPATIDRVVSSLLTRDTARREGDADRVRRELDAIVRDGGRPISEHEVGDWMRAVLAEAWTDRTRLERECLAQLGGDPAPLWPRAGRGWLKRIAPPWLARGAVRRRRRAAGLATAAALAIGLGVGAAVVRGPGRDANEPGFSGAAAGRAVQRVGALPLVVPLPVDEGESRPAAGQGRSADAQRDRPVPRGTGRDRSHVVRGW